MVHGGSDGGGFGGIGGIVNFGGRGVGGNRCNGRGEGIRTAAGLAVVVIGRLLMRHHLVMIVVLLLLLLFLQLQIIFVLVVVVVTRIVIVVVVVVGVMVLVVKGMEVSLRWCTIVTEGTGMGRRKTGSSVAIVNVIVIVAGFTSSTVRASGLVIVTSGSTVMMAEI